MDMVEQQEITLYQTKRRQHWTGYKWRHHPRQFGTSLATLK
jgi:hypothetical protein